MLGWRNRLCQLWEKILPRLKFSLMSLATIDTPRTAALKNKVSS